VTDLPKSIDDTLALLSRGDYVAERSLATAVFLALRMGRPLFLEGEAGVGKTEIAKVLAATLDRQLIRLQCYEGLDIASAVYEWNYPRQMIEIRLAEAAGGASREALAHDLFSERFLIRRPLLQALAATPAGGPAARPGGGVSGGTADPGLPIGPAGDASPRGRIPASGASAPRSGPPVLLIDELDRTDEPFEAYLLEVLSDFQITVPEIGTIKAAEPPIVVLTSNRTREIHDAVKRRCLYHWVDYPSAARELEILARKVPNAPKRLSAEVVAFVQKLRGMDLFKAPGVAETIDWSRALVELDRIALDPQIIDNTLGALLKYQDDIARIQGSEAARILSELRAELGAV
jgi:MoxR-like ATPase